MQELTQTFFKKAKELGVDLVSACSVEQMGKYPNAPQAIQEINPGAKSFLVFAVRMVSSSIACAEKNVRIAQLSTKLLYDELARITFALMKDLDSAGFSACPIPTHLPVPMTETAVGLIAEVSLRHIGYEAGFGSIGSNGLLITPQYGPRVRLGAILTTAELAPGQPTKENHCSGCDLCVQSCPTGALTKQGAEAIGLCATHHMKYGLPGLTRFAIKLIKAKTEDEKIKMIRSPEFWEYWQSLNTGIFYNCFTCLNACPVGA
jgi:epoxyqueuosine reductase